MMNRRNIASLKRRNEESDGDSSESSKRSRIESVVSSEVVTSSVSVVSPERESIALVDSADVLKRAEGSLEGASEETPSLEKLLFLEGLLNGSPDVVEAAAEELASILEPISTNVNAFVALGGHTLLFSVMDKWLSHVGIQYWLLRTVWGCTYHYDANSNLDMFAAMVRVGGLDMVCTAMKTYEDHHEIQSYAISCLVNFLTGHQADAAASNFVNKLDGISLICKVMMDYNEKESIQKGCCFLLDTLCNLGFDKKTSMQAKAPSAVSRALQQYPQNKEIALFAGSVLRAVQQR